MGVVLRYVLGGGSRVRHLEAPAAPDDVLLQSVAVLRHFRARVTRYDAEDGTLEACLVAGGRLRLSATADGQGSRVTVETHGRDWHGVARTLVRELTAAGRR